jgi:murein DD-endopeptidase MepM/ murein hydrolase activator NlpD
MLTPRRPTTQAGWLAIACLLLLASLVMAPADATARVPPRPGRSRRVRTLPQRVRTLRGGGQRRRQRGHATDARLLAILWAPRLTLGAPFGPAAGAGRPPAAVDRERLEDSLQDEIAPPAAPPPPADEIAPPLDWPLAGPINSPFGPRHGRFHSGVDIGAAWGQPVRAAAEGVALYAGDSHGPMGMAIILQHAGGLQTLYAHLARLHVREGTLVDQGAIIGTVGCTGHTTGPHLHFGVRVDGTTVNPQAYLPATPYTPGLPLSAHASAE